MIPVVYVLTYTSTKRLMYKASFCNIGYTLQKIGNSQMRWGMLVDLCILEAKAGGSPEARLGSMVRPYLLKRDDGVGNNCFQ